MYPYTPTTWWYTILTRSYQAHKPVVLLLILRQLSTRTRTRGLVGWESTDYRVSLLNAPGMDAAGESADTGRSSEETDREQGRTVGNARRVYFSFISRISRSIYLEEFDATMAAWLQT